MAPYSPVSRNDDTSFITSAQRGSTRQQGHDSRPEQHRGDVGAGTRRCPARGGTVADEVECVAGYQPDRPGPVDGDDVPVTSGGVAYLDGDGPVPWGQPAQRGVVVPV